MLLRQVRDDPLALFRRFAECRDRQQTTYGVPMQADSLHADSINVS